MRFMKIAQVKQYSVIVAASLAITLILSAILIFPILNKDYEKSPIVQFVKSAERVILDIKLNLRGPVRASPDIVIAAIDESSLKALGRWPWPRKTMGSLLDTLKSHGAKVVAFDVVFSEADLNNAFKLSKDIAAEYKKSGQEDKNFEAFIKKKVAESNTDWKLAESIKEAQEQVVLGYYWEAFQRDKQSVQQKENTQVKLLDPSKLIIEHQEISRESLRYSYPIGISALVNIDQFMQSAIHYGFLNAEPDLDSINRRVPLIVSYNHEVYPSFAFKAYAEFIDAESILVRTKASEGYEDIKEILILSPNGAKVVRPGYDGRLRINFRGPKKSYPYYKVHEILNDQEHLEEIKLNLTTNSLQSSQKSKKEAFHNKIVLVGGTAVGLYDNRPTPFNKRHYNGVEVHANVIDNLQNDNYLLRTDEMIIKQIIFMLILGVIYALVLFNLNAIWGSLLTLSLLFGLAGLDFYYFFMQLHIVNDTIIPVLQIFFIFIPLTIYNYLTAGQEKKYLIETFKNYISPELIDLMYEEKHPPKLGGDSAVLTAFFTDIEGFTSISEKLSTTDLVSLMNEYLTAMTDILLEERGTLDKYEGDAIIAFFGAPMPLKDHAVRACTTALRMQKKSETMWNEWQQKNHKWSTIKYPFRIRIGINTGIMVTGNMGSTKRMNYTMMGDSVNLTSRLESAAKQYGIYTHVSQSTYELVKDQFAFRKLDTIRVVGHEEPTTTYELLAAKEEINTKQTKLKSIFGKGLELYQRKKWQQAKEKFDEASKFEEAKYPDQEVQETPSQVYSDRCSEFIKQPPSKDWDGVHQLVEK